MLPRYSFRDTVSNHRWSVSPGKYIDVDVTPGAVMGFTCGSRDTSREKLVVVSIMCEVASTVCEVASSMYEVA